MTSYVPLELPWTRIGLDIASPDLVIRIVDGHVYSTYGTHTLAPPRPKCAATLSEPQPRPPRHPRILPGSCSSCRHRSWLATPHTTPHRRDHGLDGSCLSCPDRSPHLVDRPHAFPFSLSRPVVVVSWRLPPVRSSCASAPSPPPSPWASSSWLARWTSSDPPASRRFVSARGPLCRRRLCALGLECLRALLIRAYLKP